MSSGRWSLYQAISIAGALVALSCHAVQSTEGSEIQGAGSTFVAPIMAKWSDDYAKASGVRVVYQSVGSGAGIEKIRSGAVDFGASDKPLPPDELEKSGLGQFPVVIGGVVPVVNLPGVSPGEIRFSGEVLGDIYLGKITNWDAPQIKDLNPDVNLPVMPIAVVHRSDGSGTTYNWVDFLSKTNPAWKDKVGVGLSVNWPTGVGGDGNSGVAAAVTQAPGAIGYVEYAYAIQSKLAFAQVENAFHLFVTPSAETFQAAASTVHWRDHKDFSVMLTNASGPDAYPIAATTFILVHRTPKDPTRSAAAIAFFKWALEQGNDQASELSYVPMPPNVIRLIEAYWAAEIKTSPASD